MRDFAIKIQTVEGQQLAHVQRHGNYSAKDLKADLLDQDETWKGVLSRPRHNVGLGGTEQLEGGDYLLTLQMKAGNHSLLPPAPPSEAQLSIFHKAWSSGSMPSGCGRALQLCSTTKRVLGG